ncbi:CDP-alcohol phosphatidyltransferase family protein [Microbacterium aquilitoris]|uniref:CDP-alcohol phosphatidyltransferase family protein n=1 Tax=Microbacterium aquilitoris TaxID=3067307 RepID=UPI00288EB1DF|nr:CDP-alcohol phosphatidyltransferase family protein [Microbacterium sp. KSW2-22]MDT3345463.1 CDP-alcohol phosphatidyltransferase family protein [Microbacterium sp. KSW2-22]
MTTTGSTPPTLPETLARLRGAQKGHARGAPAYSVYVNRRIGRLFAAVAYRWGLTPNQVTMVSALHTFAGIAVIATVPPSWWAGAVVAALLVAGYAWDSADGQVARLRGGGSIAGEWLDHFVDAVKIASLHLAVLVGLYRFGDVDEVVLLVPIGFSVVATATFFGMILNDLLKAARGVASTHARAGGTFARSMLLLPTDFGVLCLAFVLWGASPLFLLVYGALFAVNALFLCAAAVKWFREMRRVD